MVRASDLQVRLLTPGCVTAMSRSGQVVHRRTYRSPSNLILATENVSLTTGLAESTDGYSGVKKVR